MVVTQQAVSILNSPSNLSIDRQEKKTENLPFTVRVVSDKESLLKALTIRRSAYARHLPEFASTMNDIDDADLAPGTVVLLAESKFDGAPLGTMRIQIAAPLKLESSLRLPDWILNKSRAEATRLGISEGRIGQTVKISLFKAYYLYCVEHAIEWMVICARDPLHKQYERLLFLDLTPEEGFIPMKHIGGIPHKVLGFDVVNAERNWRENAHPLTNFVFDTFHKDIVFDSNFQFNKLAVNW